MQWCFLDLAKRVGVMPSVVDCESITGSGAKPPAGFRGRAIDQGPWAKRPEAEALFMLAFGRLMQVANCPLFAPYDKNQL